MASPLVVRAVAEAPRPNAWSLARRDGSAQTARVSAPEVNQGSRVHTPIRFGDVEVRPTERQLMVAGRPAVLGSRAFDLLLALIEHRDRMVSKIELFDRVWPGLVVEENNLQVQISTLRKLLGPQAIATIPGRGYQFTAAIDSTAVVESRTDLSVPAAAASLTNLPAVLPPLYGREADLRALRSRIEAHQIVTVVGAGGIGKTRLAQVVGLSQVHAHGVWWIDLAAVSSADKIVPAIANAAGLELSEGDQITALAQALRERDTLLILDNCEHLIEGIAKTVTGTIGTAQRLRILATSQDALKVPGEHLYRLEVLAVPPAGTTLSVARGYGALQLLEERANAVDQSFTLNEENVEGSIDLCRHLDGIALAIEMAAARLPVLGLAEVRQRLDARFKFLRNSGRASPARQQTLRATLDWSYSLLATPDQAVLRRISTFAGSFRLDMAAQVAAADDIDEWAALDALANLVDKSLVQVLRVDPPRYRLLETVRMYASEQLAQSGELIAAQVAHGVAMARLANEVERDFWLLSDDAWSARYEPDMHDFDGAFTRACEREDGHVAVAAGQVLALREHVGVSRAASEKHKRAEAGYPFLTAALPREQAVIWDWIASCSPLVARGIPRLAAAREAVSRWQALDEPRQTYLALGRLVFESANAGDLVGASAALRAAREIEDPAWPPRLHLIFTTSTSKLAEYGEASTYREVSQRQLELAELSGARTAAAFARL